MRGLLGAEVRKLTTVPTTWILSGVGLLLVTLTSAVFTLGGSVTGSPFVGSDGQVALAVDQVGSNSVIVLVVALLVMTTEFRHGTIGRSLQITPVRTRLLTAKILVGALYAVGFFVAGVLIVVGVVLTASVVTSSPVDVGPEAVRALWQGLVGLVLTATLGVALGALIRSQVVALTVMLVWVFVVESLVSFAAPRIGRWLPFNALSALFASPETRQNVPDGMVVLLEPMVGLGVFLAYVLVAAVGAVTLLRLRDV